MSRNLDDFVPVTGGMDLPRDLIREDVDRTERLAVDSELDLHIARLLSLHPEIDPGLRGRDLLDMDAEAKLALVDQLNERLGIRRQKIGQN